MQLVNLSFTWQLVKYFKNRAHVIAGRKGAVTKSHGVGHEKLKFIGSLLKGLT